MLPVVRIPNLNLRSIIESIKIRMPAIQSEQIKSIKAQPYWLHVKSPRSWSFSFHQQNYVFSSKTSHKKETNKRTVHSQQMIHAGTKLHFLGAGKGSLQRISTDVCFSSNAEEMQDLEAIVRSLMEDQGKLAVTCIDSQRTELDARKAPGLPYDAPAPPPPPLGAPVTQPIPVVLNLLTLGSRK